MQICEYCNIGFKRLNMHQNTCKNKQTFDKLNTENIKLTKENMSLTDINKVLREGLVRCYKRIKSIEQKMANKDYVIEKSFTLIQEYMEASARATSLLDTKLEANIAGMQSYMKNAFSIICESERNNKVETTVSEPFNDEESIQEVKQDKEITNNFGFFACEEESDDENNEEINIDDYNPLLKNPADSIRESFKDNENYEIISNRSSKPVESFIDIDIDDDESDISTPTSSKSSDSFINATNATNAMNIKNIEKVEIPSTDVIIDSLNIKCNNADNIKKVCSEQYDCIDNKCLYEMIETTNDKDFINRLVSLLIQSYTKDNWTTAWWSINESDYVINNDGWEMDEKGVTINNLLILPFISLVKKSLKNFHVDYFMQKNSSEINDLLKRKRWQLCNLKKINIENGYCSGDISEEFRQMIQAADIKNNTILAEYIKDIEEDVAKLESKYMDPEILIKNITNIRNFTKYIIEIDLFTLVSKEVHKKMHVDIASFVDKKPKPRVIKTQDGIMNFLDDICNNAESLYTTRSRKFDFDPDIEYTNNETLIKDIASAISDIYQDQNDTARQSFWCIDSDQNKYAYTNQYQQWCIDLTGIEVMFNIINPALYKVQTALKNKVSKDVLKFLNAISTQKLVLKELNKYCMFNMDKMIDCKRTNKTITCQEYNDKDKENDN